MNNTLKSFDELLATICFAIFGGAVNAINQKPSRWSWRWFLAGLFTAAFTGLVVSFVLEGMCIDEKIKIAIVGMSGYAANDSLNILKQRLLDTLKKGVDVE